VIPEIKSRDLAAMYISGKVEAQYGIR